nr:hypothetical protein [Tanacetum cinerariifolium]
DENADGGKKEDDMGACIEKLDKVGWATQDPMKSKAAKKKVLVSNSKIIKSLVVQIVLWYLDSECSKHMAGDRSQLINFVQKFMGTVKFWNDHVAKILGYGDYKIGNVTISRVYFVEGLGHILFSVGQFCDSDLEASKTKSWLWHRRLSHLNFGAINHLARQGLVRGLPKLKFEKDHLCSACAMGKSKKKSHKPKSADTNQEKLYLLHMDLYGLMRVESVNGKNSGPVLNEMTPTTINSGLMQKPSSSTPYVPPSRNDWDLLFQPMFDELLNASSSVDPRAPEVIALIAAVIPPVKLNQPIHLLQRQLIKMHPHQVNLKQHQKHNLMSFLKRLKKTFMILKLHT